MDSKNLNNRYADIAFIGMMGSVCVILGAIENLVPFPVPGVRLGLANVGIMMTIYLAGVRQAALVAIIKTLIVPVFSGNIIFRFSITIPSTFVAFLLMLFAYYYLSKYSTPVTLGILGALGHMVTQLYIIGNIYIIGLFTPLVLGIFILTATFTGAATGMITLFAVDRIRLALNGLLYLKRI